VNGDPGGGGMGGVWSLVTGHWWVFDVARLGVVVSGSCYSSGVAVVYAAVVTVDAMLVDGWVTGGGGRGRCYRRGNRSRRLGSRGGLGPPWGGGFALPGDAGVVAFFGEEET